MKPARLTASGGDRAERCPAAYALDEGERSDDVYSSRGTAIHAYLEACQTDADGALAAVPGELRAFCAALPLDRIPSGDAEIAFAYNVHTGEARELGRITHRAYPDLGDGWVFATPDLITRTGRTTVIDWKTGYESVPDPKTSMQLGLCGLAVARARGLSEIDVQISRPVDGDIDHGEPVTLDAWALDDIADRWRAVVAGVEAVRTERAAGRALRVIPGDHCRWCPADSSCPRLDAAANEIQAWKPSALERFAESIATDAGAAEWWERLPAIESLVEKMRAALDARALSRSFALPSGETVGAVTSSGKRSIGDAEAVHAALVGAVGLDRANEICPQIITRETTLAKVEKVLPKSVLADLERTGGIRRSNGGTRAGIVRTKRSAA